MFLKIEDVLYKIKLRTNLLLIKPIQYVYLHVFSVYIDLLGDAMIKFI